MNRLTAIYISKLPNQTHTVYITMLYRSYVDLNKMTLSRKKNVLGNTRKVLQFKSRGKFMK